MDKLKEQLAPVQKHLFWVLSGCILIACFVSWWMATASLKTQQEQFKSTIDSQTSAVQAIQGNHPNDNTIKGMEDLIREYGIDVANGWAILAENQEKVLVWPSAFDQDFKIEVQPLRPPELKVTEAIKDQISENNRRYARDRYKEALPELAKTIGATWRGKLQGTGMGGMGSAAGMAGPGAMMGAGAVPGGDFLGGAGGAGIGEMAEGGLGNQVEEDTSIVLWNAGNQNELLQHHFAFTASDDSIPDTLQVLYAQEDLWVLQNLMNIIKATNEPDGQPITQRHEAAIKSIEYVRLGRSAFGLAGKVASASGGGATGGPGMGGMEMMGGMMGAGDAAGGAGAGGAEMADSGGNASASAGGAAPSGAGMGQGMMGAMMGAGEGMQMATSSDPMDGRYVDQKFKSLNRDRLIKAMKGEPQNPEDLLLAVAKRVPVRMSVKMNQRRMAALLANCGNSALPVEIKQVRINREGSAGGFGGGGMLPGMGGGMDAAMRGGGANSGANMGAMMAAAGGDPEAGGGFGGQLGGAGVNNPNRSTVADSTIDPNEITVEIYGIVYIYNPVNRAVLGLPAQEPPATVTPETTPVSNPPAAAAPAPNTGAGAGAAGTPLSAVN